jgi:hypothetical protein
MTGLLKTPPERSLVTAKRKPHPSVKKVKMILPSFSAVHIMP